MVKLSTDEEGEHGRQPVLQQRRDFALAVDLTPHGALPKVILDSRRRDGPPLRRDQARNHHQVHRGVDPLAELFPVRRLPHALRQTLRRGDPTSGLGRAREVLCHAVVLRNVPDRRRGLPGLGVLVVHLGAEREVRGEGLEERRVVGPCPGVDRRGIDRFEVDGVVATDSVVLKDKSGLSSACW